MDFSKIGSSTKKQAQTDPIKIFEALPSLPGTPNDLWRGQDKAITGWNTVRVNNDILISLNTGAGKTIVGLLIAQSLVNEGIENVVYLCSTIDLVEQTAKEAERIGMPHTTRIRSGFTNDLFQTGKAFCITTYAALFNGHSAIRNRHFPGAIIFDDAHVAEGLIRGAFTLTVNRKNHDEMFKEIAALFRPHFKELNVLMRFEDSLTSEHRATSFVAPRGLYERAEQLREIFVRYEARNHDDFKYPYAHLIDNINACSAIFTNGVFELTPPFLPSLALDVFEQKIRRVYLSATLQSQTDFIRAFGRRPEKVVFPENDAGNGERLIINGRKVDGGFNPEYVEQLVKTRKAVVAVPDYRQALKWEKIATPPDPKDFSKELNKFRKKTKGGFTLVSRVDGIDLPHDTCRIMILEGLPTGTSLLERYQWEFLRMNNVQNVRIANRLAQLFGRINRGRQDYGVFLLEGLDINLWLDNDRNISLLPQLLQQQIMVGRQVQEAFKVTDIETATDLMAKVIGRDEGWLDYYKREVKEADLDKDQIARANTAEPFLVEAALTEAKFAAAMWSGDYSKARREIEKTVDETAKHDTPLGGWHNVWLGGAFDLEGDTASADIAYNIAMRRLNRSMTLPRPKNALVKEAKIPELNELGQSLQDVAGYTHGNKFEAVMDKLRADFALITEGTPNQAEVGVRTLGELLGFEVSRPDNDDGTGPDVIWVDQATPRVIGFELKTDKENPATYFKKDIAQGHDHLQWMTENYPDYGQIGLLYVGPDGITHEQANPSEEMGLCFTENMMGLANRLLALLEDLRRYSPLERIAKTSEVSEEDRWDIENLFADLFSRQMKNN